MAEQIHSATGGANALLPSASQWRLSSLDDQGCAFVLRFILCAFRARRTEDPFWNFLLQFLLNTQVLDESEKITAQLLLTRASSLQPEQARALLDYFTQSYSQVGDRLFWSALGDAIQIHAIAPMMERSEPIAS